MILALYNLLLGAALLLSSPWWLWKMATTHKYREGLLARLGRTPASLAALAAERPILWLHAVSVGEALAVSRLIAELEKRFPGHCVVISTTTRTGQELARERFGEERVFYCPLDLPWAVHAYLKVLQPAALILAETEFWPNLLAGCRRRGAPVVVVNARISDRSWPRYFRLRRLWAPFLRSISCVLAQTPTDAERLLALGCRPEVVHRTGNLKFDVRAAVETEATRQLRSRAAGLRLVVAGSTLEGEEEALLAAWPRLLADAPRLSLVLAPRHPERFASVARLLERSGLEWRRRSAWKDGEEGAALPPGAIVLLDTIGELASVYALAHVAFVGGSLVPAGGHNPLEPAQFARPIVMGPHYNNFQAIAEDLLAHDAMRITTTDELARTIGELLEEREEAQAMGRRAYQVFEAQAGATARSVEAIAALLEPAS